MANVLWPNGGTATPVYWRDAPNAPFRWTSAFGLRTHPVTGQPTTMHYGLDLVGWSIIKSPVAGTVTFAGYNGGAGNEVRVRADGPNAFVKGHVYRMLHNKELWVRTGQRVSQGQDLAVMGTTGSSTGVHCHFECHPNGGAAVDPMKYMASINASTSGGGNKPLEKEDTVIPYHREDKTARAKGRTVQKGKTFYLHTTLDAPTSGATNVIGAVGVYDITAHVYASGTPGDKVHLVAVVQTNPTTKPTNSQSYTESFVIGPDGKLAEEATWKIDLSQVKAPTAVYVRLQADAANKADVKVTLLDSDAHCHKRG